VNKRVWPPAVSPPSAPFAPKESRAVLEKRLAHEDAVMQENERRRLERALERLTRELDEIEKQLDLSRPRNRRYNVNFSFDFDSDYTKIHPQTRSAIVNKGTRFYAMALEMYYKVQSSGATFNLGPIAMRELFDFEWKVRDTGTDRWWSNDWLPSDFLYSGDMCGLLTENAPALVSGNSAIEVDVRVTKSVSAGSGSLFQNIEKHLLQISFVGVEVPE
jgi:hypothetical protein